MTIVHEPNCLAASAPQHVSLYAVACEAVLYCPRGNKSAARCYVVPAYTIDLFRQAIKLQEVAANHCLNCFKRAILKYFLEVFLSIFANN